MPPHPAERSSCRRSGDSSRPSKSSDCMLGFRCSGDFTKSSPKARRSFSGDGERVGDIAEGDIVLALDFACDLRCIKGFCKGCLSVRFNLVSFPLVLDFARIYCRLASGGHSTRVEIGLLASVVRRLVGGSVSLLGSLISLVLRVTYFIASRAMCNRLSYSLGDKRRSELMCSCCFDTCIEMSSLLFLP